MTFPILQPGCTSCNAVAPDDVDSDTGRAFLADHQDCIGSFDCPALVLLHRHQADTDQPAGFRPRPVQGPPLPGTMQRVVCPNCQTIGGDVGGPRDPIAWKRAEGLPLIFCRRCGQVAGPGAVAQADRAYLRGLASPPLS